MGVVVSDLACYPDKICSLLSNFLKYDSFLADLVKISQEFSKYAYSENPEERKKVQHIQMCVLRCDFMIDQPTNSVKLVEYNTIASSFGVLSQKVKYV